MFTIVVLDAHNAGPMTGAGNHTYLLAGGDAALLIDAGVGQPEHLAELRRALDEHRATLDTVTLTHDHPDHASGIPAIVGAYPDAVYARWLGPDVSAHSDPVTGSGGRGWQALHDGDSLSIGGEPLTVLHTPGHSADHLAFWHEPSRWLFTGDLVIAGSSVMIDASRGGNLIEYLRSLERVRALAPLRLLPAHGPAIDDPDAVILRYLEHRRLRERQVIEALRGGDRTVGAIVESIYHGLAPGLLTAARETVRAHLDKLDAEGAVAHHGDEWTLP